MNFGYLTSECVCLFFSQHLLPYIKYEWYVWWEHDGGVVKRNSLNEPKTQHLENPQIYFQSNSEDGTQGRPVFCFFCGEFNQLIREKG